MAVKSRARKQAERTPVRGARKVKKVLGEFKRGQLRSSSGAKVTKRDQAVAIALSEQREADKRRRKR